MPLSVASEIRFVSLERKVLFPALEQEKRILDSKIELYFKTQFFTYTF